MTNLPDSPGYWVAWFEHEMVRRVDLIPGSTSTSPYPRLYHFEHRKLGAKNTTDQLGADSHGAGHHGDWEPLSHFKNYRAVWQKLEPPPEIKGFKIRGERNEECTEEAPMEDRYLWWSNADGWVDWDTSDTFPMRELCNHKPMGATGLATINQYGGIVRTQDSMPCSDDSCDANHCPTCGGHKLDWYATGPCSSCILKEETERQ